MSHLTGIEGVNHSAVPICCYDSLYQGLATQFFAFMLLRWVICKRKRYYVINPWTWNWSNVTEVGTKSEMFFSVFDFISWGMVCEKWPVTENIFCWRNHKSNKFERRRQFRSRLSLLINPISRDMDLKKQIFLEICHTHDTLPEAHLRIQLNRYRQSTPWV